MNHYKLLSDILLKAQGVTDKETNKEIDMGEEVRLLGILCDRLQKENDEVNEKLL